MCRSTREVEDLTFLLFWIAFIGPGRQTWVEELDSRRILGLRGSLMV